METELTLEYLRQTQVCTRLNGQSDERLISGQLPDSWQSRPGYWVMAGMASTVPASSLPVTYHSAAQSDRWRRRSSHRLLPAYCKAAQPSQHENASPHRPLHLKRCQMSVVGTEIAHP